MKFYSIYLILVIFCLNFFTFNFSTNAVPVEIDKKQLFESENDPKTLSLRVEFEHQVLANDKIPIQLTVTNKGVKDIKYKRYPIQMGYQLQLWEVGYDGTKKPATMTRWGKEKMPFPFMNWKPIEIIALAPAESLKHEMNLQRYFDVTFPGDYILKVEWFGYDDVSKKIVKYISSNEIVFKVQ